MTDVPRLWKNNVKKYKYFLKRYGKAWYVEDQCITTSIVNFHPANILKCDTDGEPLLPSHSEYIVHQDLKADGILHEYYLSEGFLALYCEPLMGTYNGELTHDQLIDTLKPDYLYMINATKNLETSFPSTEFILNFEGTTFRLDSFINEADDILVECNGYKAPKKATPVNELIVVLEQYRPRLGQNHFRRTHQMILMTFGEMTKLNFEKIVAERYDGDDITKIFLH